MSASKDKVARKELREAGQDKHQLALDKKKAERRKEKIKGSIIAAVIVLFFAFIFLYNSALPSRMATAVTIDDEAYSVAQLNYYYSNAYQNFYNTYYSYMQYGLFFDTSVSLADQDYSEDQTWRDYFIETAVENMKQVQAMYNAAMEAGFELPEEEQTAYEETIASFENNWETYGYSSLEQYINMVFGKGVTFDLVKEELYRTYVASAYSEYIYDGYEYTAEDLSAYYTEHADELDYISYAYYMISSDDEDAVATAESIAEAVTGMTATEFDEYVQENYDGDTVTDSTLQGSSLSEVYSEWLLDDARQEGDVSSFDPETGSAYVVMFLGRDTNDYPTRAFRHILINAVDEDEDGVYSDEEVAAAEASAQEILDEYLAGELTADAFGELANQYSEDTGSNTTGGLYEDVYQNEMVSPVNNWLFNEAAEEGDTTVVVYNEGGSYTGAHVLYYVGEDDMTYADSLSDSALRSEASTEWLEGLEEAMTVTTSNLGLACKNY